MQISIPLLAGVGILETVKLSQIKHLSVNYALPHQLRHSQQILLRNSR